MDKTKFSAYKKEHEPIDFQPLLMLSPASFHLQFLCWPEDTTMAKYKFPSVYSASVPDGELIFSKTKIKKSN